jgi:hypothetical protein
VTRFQRSGAFCVSTLPLFVEDSLPATSLQPYRHQPIVALMKAKHLTFPAVAHAIGLERETDVNSLRVTCYGRIYPSRDMIEKLPAYFGVPIEELFEARVLRGSPHHTGRDRRSGKA